MKPWEYADCPMCGNEIYVSKASNPSYDWHCYKCSLSFEDGATAGIERVTQ